MSNQRTPTDALPSRPQPQPHPDAAERLQRIAEQQGVAGTSRIENLQGDGTDLWESDEEFDRFLDHLRESRQRG